MADTPAAFRGQISMPVTSRRLRAFKRWMKSQGIEYSDALQFTDTDEDGIAVRALCELNEGDVVAKIPKRACLTIKTSCASSMIEDSDLDGCLGLAVAIMYEKSLGEDSPWAGYLQVLPDEECLPLVWSLGEVDQLLSGTELHKTVKEDKTLIYEDWKENILPLVVSAPMLFSHKYFGIEQYFAAKSLIASRSFEIDEYHGSGMVPLADLFNHKTGAEDVHFTKVSAHIESEDSPSHNNDIYPDSGDEGQICPNYPSDQAELSSDLEMSNPVIDTDLEYSVMGDDPTVLEMIMVKDVKAGTEVFNTYGLVGNAALLHRYGFTEPDNPYDIVNIDLELVLQWSLSQFSNRYSRARMSLWRKLNHYGFITEKTEYFEISYDGEPQVELLILLYIILLAEDAYNEMDASLSTCGNFSGPISPSEIMNRKFLLTKKVRKALLSLADIREGLYGSSSFEDDVEKLKRCCRVRERKAYHSLMLVISERKILAKLRTYAGFSHDSFRTVKRAHMVKRLRKT